MRTYEGSGSVAVQLRQHREHLCACALQRRPRRINCRARCPAGDAAAAGSPRSGEPAATGRALRARRRIVCAT